MFACVLKIYYCICLYFQGINFRVLFKRSILWVHIFVGIIFRGYELCAHGLLIPLHCAVSGYNKFYYKTSIRGYGRLVTERK